MPARREQAQERRLHRLRLEVRRGDVALQVIDRRERQPPRGGQPLGGRDADEQRADEPGPLRDRDELDVVEPHAGAGERVVDDGVDELEVMARGDLRHHAAVAVVDALRGDDVRADLPRRRDDGRAGVVAARLEREDQSAPAGRRARHVLERPPQRRGRAPHDQRVLAVVLVVAPPHAGGAEAEALIQRDRALVGGPHLERELRARVVDPLDQRRQQRGCDAAPAAARVDRDVHQVPDRVVARADQVADHRLGLERRQAHARGLGELEHEHRQRPRRRERAPLDRHDLREIGVGEAADRRRNGHRRGTASGSRR